MVVLFHWASSPLGIDQIRAISTKLPSGVDLFFVLSGYLISNALGRLLDNNDAYTAAKMFLARRWCRIILPGLVWLGIWVSLSVAIGDNIHFGLLNNNLNHAASAALLYSNIYIYTGCILDTHCGLFGYYWTLSLEWWFYIFLLLSFILIGNKLRLVILWTLLFLMTMQGKGPEDFFLHNRIDGMIAGAIVYHYRNVLPTLPKYTSVFAIFMVILASTKTFPLWHFIVIVGYTLILIAVIQKQPRLSESISWVGKLSFSIFLTHIPIIALLSMGGSHVYYLFIPITIIISYMSYLFIETPFRSIGRRISDQIAARAVKLGEAGGDIPVAGRQLS